MQLTVEGPLPGEYRWIVVVPDRREHLEIRVELSHVLGRTGEDGAVQLWIRDVDPGANSVAEELGFTAYRDLWQLRCPLPNAASGLRTRAFTDDDLDDFVAVNNRAFHWHPEQGDLTRAAVEATMSEPWFTPEGFRLLHDHDQLVGFCWTKVHPDHDPPLGEIYVIAIDPSRHGRGLGKPMTLAGLEWLSSQGLNHAMLYVESDNAAANATYEAIGFTRHHTDRAYRLDAV